jgi:hypothetical protein
MCGAWNAIMKPLSCLLASVAILAGGCAPGVSGDVKDATTGRTIAGAEVELFNSGWGFRDGQLVWDAEKISRTTTDAQGRFQFDRSGGTGLRVAAPGYAKLVAASLCSRSPMTVYVGGPYAELRADRRLLFGRNGRGAAGMKTGYRHEATADELGLRLSGTAFTDGYALRVESKGGVRLVRGSGAIPVPPPLPYDHIVDLDLAADCGWLFVSDGVSPFAVIQIAPLGWEQEPGQPRRWVMSYTPLLVRRHEAG